jgi:hypothetical protein
MLQDYAADRGLVRTGTGSASNGAADGEAGEEAR